MTAAGPDASHPNRPHDSPFKQQKLKAWQPILTPWCVISTFTTIAIVFGAIGAAIIAASNEVIDAGPFRYDDVSGSTAFVTFDWPKSTSDTVYVYYQLSNFYQNHRRYVRSRSDIQLSGTSESDKQTLGDCDPWEYFSDKLPPNFEQINTEGKRLDQIKLNPCGLIANSQFNDTIEMLSGSCDSIGACGTLTPVSWTKKGIAWKSDREKKFKNLDSFNGTATIKQQKDIEDEEFIVWMRTAGLPTFKKLHRILHDGLAEGTYTMQITQNFPVSDFDGQKAFYLSTTTWIGGKNDFLGWAYISVGIMCFVIALLFFLKHWFSPRSMGDVRAMKGWE